ncbi:phosphotransferase [Paenibacillus endoradicis]|uniref:phosphotransferase n=1 Tax=Paenibacillus endoradicis TaxID=2972487 RepID=UPI0021594769|nr:phosphotransferase [Paenibacillus endoradicis]MCR8656799.1 phosphotransferase [Paenibacillus endoradicis]
MEQQEQSSPSLETQLLNEALTYYSCLEQPTILVGHSGMNNTTRIVRDGNKQYNLRIYNNHQDKSKLQFEHEVLQRLQSQSPLHIMSPIPVYNRYDSTITELSNGKLVAMFHYIEGERPSIDRVEHIAWLATAAARLSKGLASLTIDTEPAYSPYFDIAANYEPLHEERIDKISSPTDTISQLKPHLLRIMQERALLESMCSQFATLPQQWIHGDINCSNALCHSDQVVAILDFEFVTRDARVMELAVLLAELIKPTTNNLTYKLQVLKNAFIKELPLQEEELNLLEHLVKLRVVDVAMHFIGRYEDGLDDEHILTEIIINADYAITYVKSFHV